MPKLRLDELLVQRGLIATQSVAQRICLAGEVHVDGVLATQPGMPVDTSSAVTIKAAKRFVSRGGEKLAGALEDLNFSPQNLKCVDVGASSGGFTDCLLQGGAASVTAVDVGYGQFDWQLRQDPRVALFERTSITKADPAQLGAPFDLLVADLSFTGLARLAMQLAALLGNLNDGLVLVKPQFELAKGVVKKGVVTNPADHQKAIEIAATAFQKADLAPLAAVAARVCGPKGNIEFFLWVRKGGIPATIDSRKVVQDAHRKQTR
jgi:23S rRNA (cytidine1920-2'-O)/16S rRNA (cytidine1409-2'-O)-methyltransferase